MVDVPIDQVAGGAIKSTDFNAHSAILKLINPIINPQAVDYLATNIDTIIPVDATTGNRILTLPPATGSGKFYLIIKSDSGVNTVTITPNSSDKIEGDSTRVLTNQYQKAIIFDGATALWYDLIGSNLL